MTKAGTKAGTTAGTHGTTAVRPARVDAVVALLEDPSPTVQAEVRRELDRRGRAALPALRRAAKQDDARLRARARLALLAEGRRRALRRLIGYCAGAPVDLERGTWLLSRLERPDLDARPYVLALDAMAAEVLRRIEGRPPGAERAMVLAQYLGQELGFRGDTDEYDHPDNVYLHRAIERRRGMPLTLATLYVCVARRVGLVAAPVPLPGHVVLRLRDGGKSRLVDVFEGGVEKSERDLLRFLAEQRLPFNPTWFRDADDTSMLLRQVRNLHGSYKRRGLSREARGLRLVAGVLKR